MSKSPLSIDATEGEKLKYKQGWRALNRLLHKDKSFSGRERNCAFINCEGKGFADNSAITGFDFPDDARAIVATDWDFDGDLDIWLSCRNAPRLRLLENRSQSKSHWLALELEGDGIKVNKDAIGAEVYVFTDKSTKPIMRTVYAGDGFLSQSGTLIHLGLGNIKSLNKVSVIWPDGTSVDVKGINKSNAYTIKYGSNNAELLKLQRHQSMKASVQDVFPDHDEARILLPARLPLPSLDELPEINKPTLINLWSASCRPCVEELNDWSKNVQKITRSGLNVELLNVDGDEMIKSPYPFKNSLISNKGIQALDLFQKGVLDRWIDLPVPSSFLIDHNGDVGVIYKGKVSIDQVLKDFENLNVDPEQWRLMSVPFKGRFISPMPKPDPTRVSSQLLDSDQPKEALMYLEKFNQRYPKEPEVIRMIGVLKEGLGIPVNNGMQMLANANSFRDSGDKVRAIQEYKKTLSKFPKILQAAENLAIILATDNDSTVRRPQEARVLADRLCKMTNFKNPRYIDILSMAEASCGAFEKAVMTVSKAIEIYGDHPERIPAQSRLELYRLKKPFIR